MIRLTEIKFENGIISATVTTVEMNPKVFRVVYNLDTDKIMENALGNMCMDVGMAVWKLIKLYEEYGSNLPENAMSAWY